MLRATLLGLGCALTPAGALVLPRAPPASMLLGADGNPLRSDGNAPPAQKLPPPPAGTVDDGIASGAPIAPPDRTNTLGTFSMPDDLANFDPTFDPLAVERPAYDLAAASAGLTRRFTARAGRRRQRSCPSGWRT